MIRDSERIDDPTFVRVVLCSNVFENVHRIITIDGQEPFFIRSGPVPYIWLFGARGPQRFMPVVIRNRATIPTLKVNQNLLNGEVEITFLDLVIFHATKLDSSEVSIDVIQLKQLGFDIWGQADKLYIGGSVLSGNKFNGMEIGISIGSGSKSGVVRA